MTAYYVRSGAAGAANGTSWTDAYTTLTTALATKAAGDIFYISEDHAESTGSALTLTSPGTAATPCYFYCVNHSGTVPPVSADLRTTAEIATTGNNSITTAGAGYCEGVIFYSGKTGATGGGILIGGTNERPWVLKNCALKLGGTGSPSITLPSSLIGVRVELINTTMTFASVTSSVVIQGDVFWRDTASALLGTIPTTLFGVTSSRGGRLRCLGVDLSGAGSGKTLVGNGSAAANQNVFQFVDCKLNASVTKVATPTAEGGVQPEFLRCGASGINYEYEMYRYLGTQTTEPTIVRTGGANDGTTSYSWKAITTANSRWTFPFVLTPIVIWNDTSGSSVTATVEGIWGGGAVPNNDDIWIDVQYLGSGASPQASFATGTKADNLAAGSALASSSATWGGSTTKFKMAVTFTPQQKGLIHVYVKCATASTTFYVDPKITLS